MHTLRPDRIRQRLDDLGISPREASLRASRGPDLVRFILSGKQTNTTHERTLRLAAVLDCSVDYLTGASNELGQPPDVKQFQLSSLSVRRSNAKVTALREAIDDAHAKMGGRRASAVVPVKEYDVQLSAGPGAIITDEEARAEWGLPRSFLDSMRLDARELAIVSIVGESMEPLLRDGDMVMLDLRSRNPALPGIYALWEGHATVCKRVEIVHGSDPLKLRVMSVNPAYSTYEIMAEEANVIGRVAWFGRRT